MRSGPLPHLATIEERISRLTDPDYCLGQEHAEKALFRGKGAYLSKLEEFGDRVVREAARRDIPLYWHSVLFHNQPADGIYIWHAQFEAALGPLDWDIIVHLAKDVGARTCPRVVWGGPFEAELWYLPSKRAG